MLVAVRIWLLNGYYLKITVSRKWASKAGFKGSNESMAGKVDGDLPTKEMIYLHGFAQSAI